MFESIISELAMLFTYWNTGIDLHESVTGHGNFMYAMRVYNHYMDHLPSCILGLVVTMVGLVVLIACVIIIIKNAKKTGELTVA